jgi:anti-anti-sigma factor
MEMLSVCVQVVGKVTVFQCQGSIVTGDGSVLLRDVVLSRTSAGTLVLDLGQVDSIDAGGLGLLLDLRKCTRSNGIHLKLANVPRRVQKVLELTNLDRILEIGKAGEPATVPYGDCFGPEKRPCSAMRSAAADLFG